MATYAIGDVQGCYDSLTALLDTLQFNTAHDRLWFVGDLVNRGPRSLDVLRLVRDLGHCATPVLGNHDLHLLAVAAGAQPCRPGDTLDAILNAPDCAALIDWLRQQKLVHHDPALHFTMVHAGLAHNWSITTAIDCAREVEHALADDNWRTLMGAMYGNTPAYWDDKLTGIKRLRAIINHCTRMRFCTPDGALDFTYKGPVGSQPDFLTPWFALPDRHNVENAIVFGHWSALGAQRCGSAFATDSGCVWGHTLTALHLEQRRYISIDCVETAHQKTG